MPEDGSARETLGDVVSEPVLWVDPIGTVVHADAGAARWLGVDSVELLGRPLAVRFAGPDGAALDRLCRTGWVGVGEHRFSLTDGRRVTLHAAPAPDDGEASWRVTVHDVTTRDVLDRAADERRRMEALAEFAGALARELNDPMSIVQGRLELLLELGESDPTAIERHLRVALDHARRISAALRNLRLVGQTPAPALATVSVAEAVAEALDLVGPRSRSAEIKVDLVPQDLSAAGELALYARVMANLLNLAVDSVARGGRIELKGRRVRDHVVLTVQAGGSPSTNPVGEPLPVSSSLGLAVARTLVTSIGGELDARRIKGGAVFQVTVPGPPDRPSRPRRVEDRLLVVGRETIGRSFEALLAMDGVEVVRCGDGEQALARLDAGEAVAGIAMELFLDGMSGLTLAEEVLRRRPGLRGRLLLVTDARIGAVPATVTAMSPPLDRLAVLERLGRRVKRRRT